jgi:hypothetical protein
MSKQCFSAEARSDIATIAQLASALSLNNAHPSNIALAHTQACLEATDTALKQVGRRTPPPIMRSCSGVCGLQLRCAPLPPSASLSGGCAPPPARCLASTSQGGPEHPRPSASLPRARAPLTEGLVRVHTCSAPACARRRRWQ